MIEEVEIVDSAWFVHVLILAYSPGPAYANFKMEELQGFANLLAIMSEALTAVSNEIHERYWLELLYLM